MILRRIDFKYHEKHRNMFGIFIKNIERDCKNSTKLYNKGEKICSISGSKFKYHESDRERLNKIIAADEGVS